ncbi:sensor histidine kinase [Pontibacillus yanchengensis]|nr:sensor histidine kinase [Pontibacillus yanchengensis]
MVKPKGSTKQWTIKWKIVMLALFSTLIPLLIIGPFMFMYINKLVEDRISSAAENYLSLADNNIDRFVNDIENISNIIFLSNEIQGYLNYDQTSPRLYQLETASRDLLNNITVVSNPFINAIYIGNDQHEFLKVNRGQAQFTDDIYERIQSSSWYPMLENSEWGGTWFEAKDLHLTDDSNTLMYGRVIRDLSSSSTIGYTVISVDKNVFKDMLKGVDSSGTMLIHNGKDPIYYNGGDQIQVEEIERVLGNFQDGNTITHTFDHKKYILTKHENETTNWQMISVIPYQQIIQEFSVIRIVVLAILTLSFILALVVALLISKKITGHIRLLGNVAHKMERREKVEDVGFDQQDEIGEVGARLVSLYNRNQELTTQLYESQIKEKEAELRALQSHINPHFLYNTLNSMYWMALKAKAKPIANMAISLSKLFKLTLNEGNHLTSVKNEIELVRNYLNIQNLRFDNKIDYHIDMEPGLEEQTMIKLLLQPIVENAVHHGIEPKEDPGYIEIRGYTHHQSIVFEVSDNGVGADQDHTFGYGLSNIQERIKLFYGPEYGLKMETMKGKGTKVTLHIGFTQHKTA